MKSNWTRITVLFTLLFVISVSLFGDDDESLMVPNTISVDTGPLILGMMNSGFGVGFLYERNLQKNVSAFFTGAYSAFTASGANMDIIALGIGGRYYVLSYDMTKDLYLSISGVYYAYSFTTAFSKGSLSTFGIPVEVGYKWLPFEWGLTLEPYIGYVLTFGSTINGISGLNYGLRLGFSF